MKKALEPLTGAILSIASFETWENILLSAVIALVGGFMASLGKGLYAIIKRRFERTKKADENRISK